MVLNLRVLGVGVLSVALVGLASGAAGAFLLPVLALGALVTAREWGPGGALGSISPRGSESGSPGRTTGLASQLFERLNAGAWAAAEHIGAGAIFGVPPGYCLTMISLQAGDLHTAGTALSFLLLAGVLTSAVGTGLHAFHRALRDWSPWPLLEVAG
jgi:hypothetical protein